MNVSVIGEYKSLEGLYLVLVYYRFFLPQLMDGLTIWIFFLYVHYYFFLLVFFCILHSRLLIINVQQLHTTTFLSIDFPHFQKPPLPLLNVVDCTGKNPSSLSLITPLTALKFAILSFSLYSADCQPLLRFFTTFASC